MLSKSEDEKIHVRVASWLALALAGWLRGCALALSLFITSSIPSFVTSPIPPPLPSSRPFLSAAGEKF